MTATFRCKPLVASLFSVSLVCLVLLLSFSFVLCSVASSLFLDVLLHPVSFVSYPCNLLHSLLVPCLARASRGLRLVYRLRTLLHRFYLSRLFVSLHVSNRCTLCRLPYAAHVARLCLASHCTCCFSFSSLGLSPSHQWHMSCTLFDPSTPVIPSTCPIPSLPPLSPMSCNLVVSRRSLFSSFWLSLLLNSHMLCLALSLIS